MRLFAREVMPQWRHPIHVLACLDQPRRRWQRIEQSASQDATCGLVLFTPGPAVEIHALLHHLIAQQPQPVAHAACPQHLLEARGVTRACSRRTQSPQAQGLEAQHDQLTLAGEHAIGLAHDGVRIGVEVQRVRQQYCIDGGRLDGKRRQARDDVYGGVRCLGNDALAPGTTGRQELP
jgi:hypothetical protein